jgi:hypothetical protein
VSIEPDGPAIGPTSTVSVPAELRFLEVVCTAVRTALADSDCDSGCMRDLELATDELASILITSADHPSQLSVAVTDDEADVYVRMLVPVAPGGSAPHVAELTRMLLDASVESYELRLDGDHLLGVLQRALIDDDQR